MNFLTEYYKQYHKEYGKKAYMMEHSKDSSRVYTLKEWIRKYVRKGGKILDIGCGDMFLAKELPEYDWLGIDICNLQSDGRATEWDIMQTPYPYDEKSLDAVICSEVLEHVWDPEIVHKEALRLIKRSGVYVISTPNHDHIDMKLSGHKEVVYDSGWTHLKEHIRFYNLDAHKKMLDTNKFTVVEYTGADPHFSKTMEEARQVLKARFPDWEPGARDELLGAMFPTTSHTIVIAARPT